MGATNKLLLIVSAILVFFYSLYFSSLSVGGDQKSYSEVYYKLSDLTVASGYLLYASVLSKVELIYFGIIYLGAKLGFDKTIYMSFFNSILFIFASRALNKIGMPLVFSILIVWTNYYTQMLFFTGERLKFGMILFFAAFIFTSSYKNPAPYLIFLSILGHLQILILWLSLSSSLVFSKLVRVFKKLKVSRLIIFVFIFTLLVAPIILPQIISKVIFYMSYYGNSITMGFFKWLVFFILTIISSNSKFRVATFYFTLLFPFLIVGSERLVIFCNVFFYMQYSNKSRYFNIVSVIVFLYFSIKSIPFLVNIYFYGDGFY